MLSRHSERGGEILLLTPGWTSVVVVWRVVASMSISPPCTVQRRESPDWGEQENVATMLCCHSEHGGEILLLTPFWTLSSSFGAWLGDTLTRHQAPKDDDNRCPA